MKAKFEVRNEETAFSRSEELPLEGRAHTRELAENLSKAFDLYSIQIENDRMKKALEEIYQKSEDNWAAAVAETGLGMGMVLTTSEHINIKDSKSVFMSNLYHEVKSLVRDGIYSIYRLEDNSLILYTPASRIRSVLGSEDIARIYAIDEIGNVIQQNTDNDLKNYGIKEYVYLKD